MVEKTTGKGHAACGEKVHAANNSGAHAGDRPRSSGRGRGWRKPSAAALIFETRREARRESPQAPGSAFPPRDQACVDPGGANVASELDLNDMEGIFVVFAFGLLITTVVTGISMCARRGYGDWRKRDAVTRSLFLPGIDSLQYCDIDDRLDKGWTPMKNKDKK